MEEVASFFKAFNAAFEYNERSSVLGRDTFTTMYVHEFLTKRGILNQQLFNFITWLLTDSDQESIFSKACKIKFHHTNSKNELLKIRFSQESRCSSTSFKTRWLENISKAWSKSQSQHKSKSPSSRSPSARRHSARKSRFSSFRDDFNLDDAQTTATTKDSDSDHHHKHHQSHPHPSSINSGFTAEDPYSIDSNFSGGTYNMYDHSKQSQWSQPSTYHGQNYNKTQAPSLPSMYGSMPSMYGFPSMYGGMLNNIPACNVTGSLMGDPNMPMYVNHQPTKDALSKDKDEQLKQHFDQQIKQLQQENHLALQEQQYDASKKGTTTTVSSIADASTLSSLLWGESEDTLESKTSGDTSSTSIKRGLPLSKNISDTNAQIKELGNVIEKINKAHTCLDGKDPSIKLLLREYEYRSAMVVKYMGQISCSLKDNAITSQNVMTMADMEKQYETVKELYETSVQQSNERMLSLKDAVLKCNSNAIEEKARYKKKIQASFKYNYQLLVEKEALETEVDDLQKLREDDAQEIARLKGLLSTLLDGKTHDPSFNQHSDPGSSSFSEFASNPIDAFGEKIEDHSFLIAGNQPTGPYSIGTSNDSYGTSNTCSTIAQDSQKGIFFPNDLHPSYTSEYRVMSQASLDRVVTEGKPIQPINRQVLGKLSSGSFASSDIADMHLHPLYTNAFSARDGRGVPVWSLSGSHSGSYSRDALDESLPEQKFVISANSLEAATEAEVSQFGSYDPSEEKENDSMVDASNVLRVIERLNNKSIEVEFRNKLHSMSQELRELSKMSSTYSSDALLHNTRYPSAASEPTKNSADHVRNEYAIALSSRSRDLMKSLSQELINLSAPSSPVSPRSPTSKRSPGVPLPKCTSHYVLHGVGSPASPSNPPQSPDISKGMFSAVAGNTKSPEQNIYRLQSELDDIKRLSSEHGLVEIRRDSKAYSVEQISAGSDFGIGSSIADEESYDRDRRESGASVFDFEDVLDNQEKHSVIPPTSNIHRILQQKSPRKSDTNATTKGNASLDLVQLKDLRNVNASSSDEDSMDKRDHCGSYKFNENEIHDETEFIIDAQNVSSFGVSRSSSNGDASLPAANNASNENKTEAQQATSADNGASKGFDEINSDTDREIHSEINSINKNGHTTLIPKKTMNTPSVSVESKCELARSRSQVLSQAHKSKLLSFEDKPEALLKILNVENPVVFNGESVQMHFKDMSDLSANYSGAHMWIEPLTKSLHWIPTPREGEKTNTLKGSNYLLLRSKKDVWSTSPETGSHGNSLAVAVFQGMAREVNLYTDPSGACPVITILTYLDKQRESKILKFKVHPSNSDSWVRAIQGIVNNAEKVA